MGVPTRRAAVLAALVAVTIAGLASTATGTRVVKINSKVTIQSRSLVFHGKVRSPNPGCRGGRKVKFKRVISGGPDQVVGRDTSDSRGRWRITPQGSAGISLAHFYARVRRSSEGTAGTIFVCRGDRSRTVGANS
ncbi:MAG: hypothetical protein ACXWZM_01695 [Solirubrobacterales bacterium]